MAEKLPNERAVLSMGSVEKERWDHLREGEVRAHCHAAL